MCHPAGHLAHSNAVQCFYRRRQVGLREGVGAVAAHPHRGDDPGLGHLDARRPQRRVAGQRRRGQGVEGELHRVQAEGGEVRQEISGGTHVKRGEGGGRRRRHEQQQQGTTKSRINSDYRRFRVF